jgi:uncharacterized protein YegL
MMSDNRLYVHVLLDRSGSMESCRDSTIKAFNDYITRLKEAWKTPTCVSLTLFDSESIDLLHEALSVGDVPELTRKSFVPRGGTPLLDAIGQTAARIDAAKLVWRRALVDRCSGSAGINQGAISATLSP